MSETEIKGILGNKLGMTQVFDEQNRVVPVTVVKAGPCVVTLIDILDPTPKTVDALMRIDLPASVDVNIQ